MSRLKNILHDNRYGIIIALLIIILSYYGAVFYKNTLNSQMQREFAFNASVLEHAIEDKIKVYDALLSGMRGLYDSSDVVSRNEWHSFTASQDLLNKYPEINRLEYIERVTLEEYDEFIGKIQEEGFLDFTIKPLGSREEYLVVNYIESLKEDESIFGFDLASNKEQRGAFERAGDANELVITSLILEDNIPVFWAMLPIYSSAKIETIKERREYLQGYVLGVFKYEDIILNTLEQITLSSKVKFSLIDNDQILFNNTGDNNSTLIEDEQLFFRSKILVGGHIWEYTAYPTDSFYTIFKTQSSISIIIFIAGILLGLFILFIFYLVVRSKRSVAELAKTMTDNFKRESSKVFKINKDLERALNTEKHVLSDSQDQQKAILNILEDAEEERNEKDILAKDLEKFKLAVDNTSDHIVITDKDGNILYANQAVERITGYTVKEIMGQKAGIKKLWGGNMGEEFYKKLWKTLKEGKKNFSGDIANTRKNGEAYDAVASISPILDDNNEVKFIVGVERDVTMERQIDKAKTEFVSLASHQLRTPLSTIGWYTEMLLSDDAGKVNKEQREYLKEIYKGNQRMVDLVSALLNVSRIELGTLAVDVIPTDLVDISESVLDEVSLSAKKKELKIIKKYAKNLPKVPLDPKLMRIVWQNLLTNSIKYTLNKGIVTINIKKVKTDILLSVSDTGMGIPKAQQKNIFSKLFRADNVRESDTDGTGLGLYIVKAVVEQFNGKVWFESVENKGTTFFIQLPITGSKAKAGVKGLEYTK